ncbi:MAG TPA: hypothetical protein VGJ86_21605 [Acidimicrobiales bacterium]|jgi:hypothetical protein
MQDTIEDQARIGSPRRTSGATIAVIAAAAAVAVLLWATDDNGSGSADASPPPASSTQLPDRTPTPPTTAVAPAVATPPTVPPAAPEEPVLADGRHPVLLTDLDLAGSTVEFDLIQYLSGDAALAYTEAHEYESGFEDYDYYIVNENPRLRRLSVVDGAEVIVLQTATSTISPHTIAFADLPGYVHAGQGSAGEPFAPGVFWLTVRDDTVVAIEEQFTP